jgi:hypothetical protein
MVKTTNKDLEFSAFLVCFAMANTTGRKLRYELQLGSKVNGVSYTLDIFDERDVLTSRHFWLGRTKTEALRSLDSMTRALNAAVILKT